MSTQLSQMNSPEIAQIVEALKSGHLMGSRISYFDGKIYEGDVMTEGVNRRNFLVDVNKFHARKTLAAAGRSDDAAGVDPFSDRFKGFLQEYRKVVKSMDMSYLPYHHLDRSVLAAAGPVVPTAYETVRRVNYLTEVKGPKYRMDIFNAIKGVEVRQTTDLNFLGYTRSALLAAQKEIADHITPDLVTNSFSTFEKQLFADAWRFEFSQRELKDSAINLRDQVTQDMEGAFAKLKDDKIVAEANAASSTTPTTDWDARLATYETHYTSDAAADIETADIALRSYGGAAYCYMRSATARAYLRNVNGTTIINKNSIGVPTSNEGNLEWQMPLNPRIMAIVNEGINSAEAVVCARGWCTLYQGAVVQVSYKNPMTSGQVEGMIHFDFNGVKRENASFSSRLLALLT